jgi:uncharacterized membrane protein
MLKIPILCTKVLRILKSRRIFDTSNKGNSPLPITEANKNLQIMTTTYNLTKIEMTDGSVYIMSSSINIPHKKNHAIKTIKKTGVEVMVNDANGFCYKMK